MALTFKEAQDAALHDDFNPNKYRVHVKRFVNQAIGRIYRLVAMPESPLDADIVTAYGLVSYPLPGTNLSIESLRSDTRGALEQITIDEYDAMTRGTPTPGAPAFYALRGTNVLLFPTPDSVETLRLRYRRLPTELSNDEDLIPLSDDYEDMVVTFARMRLHALEGDTATAQALYNDWIVDLRELRSVQRRDRKVRQTPGTWAGMEAQGPNFVRPASWD